RRERSGAGLDRSSGAYLDFAALYAEIKKVREEKEAKIAAQEHEAAADLRDQERELVSRARDFEPPWLDGALAQLRGRLGLPDSSPGDA
nr:hypothetical protein [Thermoleophilaceae bacterium]